MISDQTGLSIGDRLQVTINDEKQVSTNVEMINGDNIWVSDFMADIWDIPWRRHAFDVSFVKKDMCYSFLVEIQGREKIENLMFTRMLKVSSIEEVQRRSSYRLMESYDIYIREAGFDGDYVKCRGVDISEIGAGFNSRRNWNQGDEVECRFELGGVSYHFFAKVRRKIVWLNNDTYEYRIGIRFETKNDKKLEKSLKELRRFIFKRQIARKL